MLALDTNVVSPILNRAEPAAQHLSIFLDQCNQDNDLVVCGPVYAELLAGPHASVDLLDEFLDGVSVTVDHTLSLVIWRTAGDAFREYGERRVSSGHQWPRRILADFVIGAHALEYATALITFDGDDFRCMFPTLAIIAPPEDVRQLLSFGRVDGPKTTRG